MLFSGRIYRVDEIQVSMLLAVVMSASGSIGSGCLSVAAKSHTMDDNHLIEFSVNNQCDRKVEISPMLLPWGSPWSVRISAFTQASPNMELKEGGVLYHSNGEHIFIDPGHSLEGAVSLDGWFPQFRKAICEADIKIYWNYSFPNGLAEKSESGIVLYKAIDCSRMQTDGS